MFTSKYCSNRSLFKIINFYRTEVSNQLHARNKITIANEIRSSAGVRILTKFQRSQCLAVPSERNVSISTEQPRQPISASSEDEARDFMAVFPDLLKDLTQNNNDDVAEPFKRIREILEYNVPGGKKNRGLATVMAYKILEKPENLTPENIRLAQIMGWCIEMLQAYLVINDDLMDHSELRRGLPCWYRCQNLGLAAINDAILLYCSMLKALQIYFQHKPYYVNCLHTMNEALLKTSMGQYLDLMTAQDGRKPDLEMFTLKNYKNIVKYKTSYYSFQLPASMGLIMAGILDPQVHKEAEVIFLEMGELFQIQDDYLDCFGSSSLTGKTGTDIQDGKCSWLAVMALEQANLAQKMLMEEIYGSNNPEHINQVKKLYENLKLPEKYTEYEKNSYDRIKTHINNVSKNLPQELFYKFLDKIYKRRA